jgi:integral membrane protein (TIGR00529 family)
MIRIALSLVLAFGLMLFLSRYRLWLGVLAAGVIFGLFNYELREFFVLCFQTFSSIPNWLLVIGVGLIPVLGMIMRDSVHLAELLQRLKKRKKIYLMLTPLLFGLLPIPGGALLSCPLIKGVDSDISGARYVAINLWFRHLLVIVYPLSSSIIIAAQLAGLSIAQAILSMSPVAVIMFVVGYLFLIKGLKREEDTEEEMGRLSINRTVRTLLIFLSAPILHITLSTTILSHFEQLSFFISMLVSIIIAIISNRLNLVRFIQILKKSKFDQFSLLFLFLLLFLNMVRSYENLELLFSGFHPPLYFVGIMAFVLTFLSGRIEISLSIIYPFIFTVYAISNFSPSLFRFVYFSLFAGYLISPLHPCLAFTTEYFQTGYWMVFKKTFPLLLIVFIVVSMIFIL